MDTMISIDPGSDGCGFAFWAEGVLLHAEYVSGLGGAVHPLMQAALGLERNFRDLATQVGTIETLVIEYPQVYATAQQKGDQQDLIKLAIVVGGIMRMASMYTKTVLPVLPREWKGQAPKDVTEHRMQKHLTEAELAAIQLPSAKSLHHNVWDAVGIGYWRAHG